jgi:VanZ family protein
MTFKLSCRLVFISYCLFIGYASLQPSTQNVLMETFSDKLLHAVAYLIMIILARPVFASNRHYAYAAAAIALASAAIELLQGLIPGRDPSLADLAANSLGIIAGLALTRLLANWPIARRVFAAASK